MKVDVEKLINQIRKHPEIYNPDHKDFSNKEIRDMIFNTLISKEMSGTKGEILNRKWNQILSKYASFLRKLSNDDSSETVLERFMEWPWTKHMRIFKPYVRKQFQISAFQPAIQIPEMDPDELPDIPFLMPSISFSTSTPRSGSTRASSRPDFSHPTCTPRQESPHPPWTPTAGSGFARAASRVEFRGSFPIGVDFSPPPSVGPSRLARGTAWTGRVPLPAYDMWAAAASTADGDGSADDAFRDIASMMGLDQPSDGDDGTDSDSNSDSDESAATADGGGGGGRGEEDGGGVDIDGETEGRPAAKRSRPEEKPDDARDERGGGDDVRRENDGDHVLQDLPQPKPLAERGPSGFTAQEHVFLAWAKTMSTFTAKRQAVVKMKINEIMSEAEFEDLDDEFFAANSPTRRPIYSSRR